MRFLNKQSVDINIHRYLTKHAKRRNDWDTLPVPSETCRLCIVIPAMAEFTLIGQVFDSLIGGSQRLSEAEIIVVVNNPAHTSQATLEDNYHTLSMIRKRFGELPIHALDYATPGQCFKSGASGVGMARRIGMDLALQRLFQNDHGYDGVIACLDGDSPVAPGYIDHLLEYFQPDNLPLAGLCNYAHTFTPQAVDQALAVMQYEIWLRYFELGFHLTGSGFSATPIGSCMVISAQGYAACDGMVVREAGEDFYFWQKLVKISEPQQLRRLKDAVVFPSSRISNRMPFGTSRALHRIVHENSQIYHRVDSAEAFLVLRNFFKTIPTYFLNPEKLEEFEDSCMREFLIAEKATVAIDKMRKINPTVNHFTRAFLQWFDGLRCIRFIHNYTMKHGAQLLYDALEKLFITACFPIPECGEEKSEFEKKEIWLKTLRGLTYPDWF